MMGRSRLSLQETLFSSIQNVYSQLSRRRAHSFFQNAVERGKIRHAPRLNALSDFFDKPESTPILHNLVTLSALPIDGIEVDFSVDLTGFRTTCFSAYNGTEHGQKKEHQWVKAHVCSGVKTNVVVAVAITEENGVDSPQFGHLIRKIAEGFTVNEIMT